MQDNIIGVSYVGRPRSNTAMFIVKKVEHLLQNLYSVNKCLVFIDDKILVPEDLNCKHNFIRTSHPQKDYADFVNEYYEKECNEAKHRKYRNIGGAYIGENVKLGKNVFIDVGCVIGHDVVIGSNSEIFANSVIKNAIIDEGFILREGAIIGSEGFTLTKDDANNWYRIRSIGKVKIGKNVEIGVNTCVARGTADATYIGDYVKIDALVYVGHDSHIGKNTEISAGGIVGGFVETEENVSLGFNSCVRNRILIGDGSVIGMGATVVKSVNKNDIVIGNPAKSMK